MHITYDVDSSNFNLCSHSQDSGRAATGPGRHPFNLEPTRAHAPTNLLARALPAYSSSLPPHCVAESESRRIAGQRLAIRRFDQNERLGDSAIRRFGDSAVMNWPARPGRVELDHRENTLKLVCLLQGSDYTPVIHKEHNIGFSMLLKLNTAAHDFAVSVPEHLG